LQSASACFFVTSFTVFLTEVDALPGEVVVHVQVKSFLQEVNVKAHNAKLSINNFFMF
jgi:hypothetical protein